MSERILYHLSNYIKFGDAREAFLRVGAKDLLLKAEQELGRFAPSRR